MIEMKHGTAHLMVGWTSGAIMPCQPDDTRGGSSGEEETGEGLPKDASLGHKDIKKTTRGDMEEETIKTGPK